MQCGEGLRSYSNNEGEGGRRGKRHQTFGVSRLIEERLFATCRAFLYSRALYIIIIIISNVSSSARARKLHYCSQGFGWVVLALVHTLHDLIISAGATVPQYLSIGDKISRQDTGQL